MELRHLRYFVAVAEEQNVTRAAKRLHVSQPPVSRQIRDLEDELGIALFEHGAKSLRLTEAGRLFLESSRLVLRQVDAAVLAAKSVANGQSGEFHIGYAPSLTVDFLPKTLRSFQAANPGLRVQLHDMSTQEMLRGLRKGQLHVTCMVQVSSRVLAEFAFEEVCRYAICVAMHPAHPLARTRQVSLEQVAAEPLIAFALADYPEHHLWLSELFASINRPLRIKEEHDSVASLITAVEASCGVALVLEPFKCFSPRVKVRPITPAPPPLPVGIARSKDNTSPSIDKFMTAARLSKPKV